MSPNMLIVLVLATIVVILPTYAMGVRSRALRQVTKRTDEDAQKLEGINLTKLGVGPITITKSRCCCKDVPADAKRAENGDGRFCSSEDHWLQRAFREDAKTYVLRRQDARPCEDGVVDLMTAVWFPFDKRNRTGMRISKHCPYLCTSSTHWDATTHLLDDEGTILHGKYQNCKAPRVLCDAKCEHEDQPDIECDEESEFVTKYTKGQIFDMQWKHPVWRRSCPTGTSDCELAGQCYYWYLADAYPSLASGDT